MVDFKTPPRNLSADQSHPWFSLYWCVHGEILIDGVRRERVVTASADEGWAECIAMPWERLPGGGLRRVRFRGKVEIRRRETADA